MIDNDNEVSLVYLLEPTFQIMNTAGKPLTDGYLEVYIHGTRERYYCSSDFDGTLHPFKVPLDSLGSNIVLVSPFNAYDIYVYNKYGSLQMSRYNVTPGSNWVDISGQEQYFIGEGQLIVDASLGSSSYLLDNLTQIDGNLPVSSGNLELPDECLYNVEANFEFEVLNYNLINQDVEISVEIKNPCRVTEHTNIIKGFTTINTTNVNKNTLTLCGLIYGGKDSISGIPHLEITFKRDDEFTTPAQIRAHLTNISVYKIAGLIGGQGGGGANYGQGNGIRIVNNTISTKVDGETIIYNANGEMVSVGGHEYTAGQFISIDNNVISASGLQPAGDYVSKSYVDNNIASGLAAANEYTDQQIILNQNYIDEMVASGVSIANNYTDLQITNNQTYVDNTVVSGVEIANAYTDQQIANIPSFEQVNSDWDAVSGVAEILHKPETINLIAGSGIDISTSGSGITISSTGTVGTTYTAGDYIEITNDIINVVGVQPAGNYATYSQLQSVSASIPDISGLATKQELQSVYALIPDVSDFVTSNDLQTVYGDLEGDIQTVSANIPDISGLATIQELQAVSASIPEQVNSDWDAVSGKAEILHKPTIYDIKAGEGIIITESANTLTISASGIPDYYVTETELNESIQSATALIPDVSDFITNSELNTVSGILEGQIQSVSANIPDISDLATETYVDNTLVSAKNYTDTQIANIPSQVNSDWDAVSGVSQILNKPTIYNIVAGEGINVTQDGNDLEISSTVEYNAGQYISIVNNTIAATGLQPVGDYATNADLQAATALIPDVSDFVTNGVLNNVSGIIEGQIESVSASIPDISGLATKQELQAVSSSIPDVSGLATETYVDDTLVSAKNYTDAQISNLPTPVNADWEANSGLSQILNKPIEKELISGRFINIEDTSVSGVTISITGIEPQCNSDWEAVSGVTHILNKPIEKELIPGNYISLDYNNGDIEIAVTGVQPAGNYLTSSDLNGYATQTYVNNAVSGKVSSTNVTNVTYVNSLPGSPVTGTLYLIPET